MTNPKHTIPFIWKSDASQIRFISVDGVEIKILHGQRSTLVHVAPQIAFWGSNCNWLVIKTYDINWNPKIWTHSRFDTKQVVPWWQKIDDNNSDWWLNPEAIQSKICWIWIREWSKMCNWDTYGSFSPGRGEWAKSVWMSECFFALLPATGSGFFLTVALLR